MRLPGNVATSWTAANAAAGPPPQRTARQKASKSGMRVTFAAQAPKNRPGSGPSEVQQRVRRDPQTGAILE
jgi:hypothetical protein